MDDKNTAYLAALAGLSSAPTPVTRDEALLNAIIDRLAAIEEGGGLPDVTAEDNGDVLTVVDGAWGKAAPSGGGGVLAISATYDSDTEMMTLDKTFGEISAAFVAGQMYFVHVPETAGTIFAGYYAVTSLWIYSDDSGTVSMLYNDNGTPLYINFDANAADEYPSKYLGE